jgi:predicted metal-dependent peptidase
MNIEERINLTFSKMGLREPFIAAVMTRVKRELSDKVPTAGTNGTWVRFNPTWCAQWNDEQLFGLSLHEALHVVLMHMWRREGRDPSLWNYANDAVINAYIRARGYQLPDGGVHVSWVKEDMDSEEVYAKLKKNPPPPQDGAGGDKPNAGGFDGQGDIEDAQDEATRVDMEATIATAAKMAKDCGQGSALIDRILERVGQSNVRWQDETRAMLTEAAAADYSYRRPNRRFLAEDLYLPSLHSESLGGLAVGFDTSGSMGPAEANQIAAELQAIVDDLQPAFVEVIYCDYSVTSVQRFERDEPMELKPKGGGGTRFKPVFDHIEASGERYCGIIFFTDLEGNLDECKEPEVPVIWADIGRSHPAVPFGSRVNVPL